MSKDNGDVQSIIDGFRRRREELINEDHFKDLDVPGYEDKLVLRCRPFPITEVEKMATKMRSARGSQLMTFSCQTVINACDEVLLRLDPDGDPEPWPVGPDEAPMALDKRLADALGYGDAVQTARDVVIGLYTAANEHAILEHATTLTQWMRDVTKDADRSLVGE